MATNRQDTLDPALLRPGRLDRKIEFPLPDRRQKRLIFSTITSKMNLSEEVDLEDYVARWIFKKVQLVSQNAKLFLVDLTKYLEQTSMQFVKKQGCKLSEKTGKI